MHAWYLILVSFVVMSVREDRDYKANGVPNQFAYLASLFKFEEFGFMEYTSHHFEDLYLMETSGTTSGTLTLAIIDCLFLCEGSNLEGHPL